MDLGVTVDGRSGDALVGCDFSGRKEERFTAIAAVFEDCNFSRVRCRNTDLGSGMVPTVYRRCCFDNANLTFLPGGAVKFEDCSFVGARLSKWSASSGSVTGCRFSGKLYQCIFWGPRREGGGLDPFERNDFSGAEMKDCSFRAGIDLTQQMLPSGPEFFYAADGRGAIAAARGRVARDPERLGRMSSILTVLEGDLDRGQVQLFDQAASWQAKYGADTWRALWGIDTAASE